MTESNSNGCRYVSSNGDEYILTKQDGIWYLYIIEKENPKGRFIAKNKSMDKLCIRIPEGLADYY